jgi:hypothetical protein
LPGFVVLSLGVIKKFGNFPVMKDDAPPQSIDYSVGVSSVSGSLNAGNLKAKVSLMFILISYGGCEKTGGPLFATCKSIGINNVPVLRAPALQVTKTFGFVLNNPILDATSTSITPPPLMVSRVTFIELGREDPSSRVTW